MATKIIVSYDGTNNEDDAIALGRILGAVGAEVAIGYVRHSEELVDDQEAAELLARGRGLLGDPNAAAHVVTDRSTPEGLRGLAEREGADLIVFCSDSHTAKGHVSVGNSAQRLLDGGRFAIAIASAGLADRGETAFNRIALGNDSGDQTAQQTAQALAQALGGSVSQASLGQSTDLLVLASRPEAGVGQVALSAASMNLIEGETGAVLALPRGVKLDFAGVAALSH
jgi:nucleotide-binding universal stress UspA family protein